MTTHGVWITPQECQIVWKFLAYGQHFEFKAGKELLPDSDEEEYDQSPKQISARLAAGRAKSAGSKLGGAAAKYSTTVGKQDIRAGEGGTGTRGDGRPLNDVTEARLMKSILSEASVQQTTKRASIRLYPTYSFPTGVPDAWHRPFGPKDALPLTFVASRFLRRKPTPPPAPSRVQQLTILPSPSATGPAELKREQADDNAEAAKKAKLVA
uniref:Uncharacterized protein n=1 Tax=Hyaloperonospora arabidopsidis (strain Emoy2) TaxID=559515 RepID=M4BLD8_HYAAE